MRLFYHYSKCVLGFTFLLFLALASDKGYAQQATENLKKTENNKTKTNFTPHYILRGNLGANVYNGDLSKNAFDLGNAQLNGELAFGRQFTSWFALEGELWRGFLKGENEKLDRKFDSDLFGGDLNTRWNLSNIFGGFKEDRLFSFEATLGLGQAHYRSRLYELSSGKFITSSGFSNSTGSNKGSGIQDRKVIATVPVGLSMNIRLNEHWDLNLQSKMTYAATEYLDLVKDPDHKGISQDHWNYTGVGLIYKFKLSNGLKKMSKDFAEEVKFEANPEVLVERGDSVQVNITANFPPKFFDKKAVVYFQPVLKSDNNEVVLKGINLIGEKVIGDGERVAFKTGGQVKYSTKIAYQDFMEMSDLTVTPVLYAFKNQLLTKEEVESSRKDLLSATEVHLAYGVIHTSDLLDKGAYASLAPDMYEKISISTQNAKLFFNLNSASLNWSVKLNRNADNLAALKGLTNDVRKGWLIKDIQIYGFASPEGEELINQNLSEKRGNTAMSYMKNKLRREARIRKYDIDAKEIKEVKYDIVAEGPDWDGLNKEIANSDIQDKDAILNVYNKSSLDSRQEELSRLAKIYPELAQQVLPILRRTDIAVNCFEPKHSDEEILQMSVNAPQDLKVNELLYAATLTSDVNAQKSVYAKVVKLYPEDYRAYVNLAVIALNEGQLKEATVMLDKAKAIDAEAVDVLHNLGVAAAMMNEWDKASKYFEAAQAKGMNEDKNFALVAIQKGDYDKAIAYLANEKADFNLALAYTLTGKYDEAKAVLTQLAPTAETHYLSAVLAARTNDEKQVYAELIQVVKLDPDYKSRIKTDREFKAYDNKPEFGMIVK